MTGETIFTVRMHHGTWYYILPGLHADLFSHHASPSEVYVLWRSTTEGDEDVMFDEICRRCYRKQRRRRRGDRRAELPCWVMEQNQKAKYYCSYLQGHKNVFIFGGGISERRPTNTAHHLPSIKCEAMQKPLQGRWVGAYRSVGVGHQVK